MLEKILVWSLLLTLGSGASPPPRPAAYVADYANLLSAAEKVKLLRQVGEQNARSDSHLFVIAVPALKNYGYSDVQAGAKACFVDWELREGDVLLFLSASERKAKIQLGVNWSSRWNMEIQRIMSEAVVPACDQGECARALLQGSQRLLAVTAAGPSAALPARNWKERLENLGATASSRSGLPWVMCLVFMGGGMLLLLCSLLPIASSARIFAATLGLVLLVSCYSAQGVLSAFWVLAGAGVLWMAGSAIQAGYQAGAPPRGSGDSGGSEYYDSSDYSGND